MKSGSRVIVSHVVSPSEFYVKNIRELTLVDRLEQDLWDAHVSAPGVSRLETGQLACMMKRTDPGKMVRAAILCIAQGIAEIQLLDYGNILEIPVKELFAYPLSAPCPPAIAYYSCLYDIHPRSYSTSWDAEPQDQWTQQAIEDFRWLVEHRILLVALHAETDGILHLDLVEDGPRLYSVRETMIFLRRGCKPYPALDAQASLRTYKELDLPMDKKHSVIVSFTVSPSHFYCLVLDDQLERLLQLEQRIMARLQLMDEDLNPLEPIEQYDLRVGMACIWRRSEDSCIRAIITAVRMERKQKNVDHVEVRHVDSGSTHWVRVARLYRAEPEFLEIPALAVKSHLFYSGPAEAPQAKETIGTRETDREVQVDMGAVAKADTEMEKEEEQWKESEIQAFKGLTEGKELIMNIWWRNSSDTAACQAVSSAASQEVCLFDTISSPGWITCISSVLVESGMARYREHSSGICSTFPARMTRREFKHIQLLLTETPSKFTGTPASPIRPSMTPPGDPGAATPSPGIETAICHSAIPSPSQGTASHSATLASATPVGGPGTATRPLATPSLGPRLDGSASASHSGSPGTATLHPSATFSTVSSPSMGPTSCGPVVSSAGPGPVYPAVKLSLAPGDILLTAGVVQLGRRLFGSQLVGIEPTCGSHGPQGLHADESRATMATRNEVRVRALEAEIIFFLDVCGQLEELTSLLRPAGEISTGKPLLVKARGDHVWTRVEVLEVQGDQVLVQDVDTCREQLITITPDSCKMAPPQATRCPRQGVVLEVKNSLELQAAKLPDSCQLVSTVCQVYPCTGSALSPLCLVQVNVDQSRRSLSGVAGVNQ